MAEAAQGEPIDHVVFREPFKVAPSFEEWDTPQSYQDNAGGATLPAKVRVWRVQATGSAYGGVISRSFGFLDSPDAEILAPGYNTEKENGAVGVGRHGNVLQWGFSAPPSKMTGPGQRFFLNCICYIDRFDGKGPLVLKEVPDRTEALRVARLVGQIDNPEFATRSFDRDLYKAYKDDREGLVRFLSENLELVYWDKAFFVDEDLRSLGLSSNREVATLEKLIGLLAEGKEVAAVRRALKRYTTENLRAAEQWQQWLEASKGSLFFSDAGGYKFRVVPPGYLE
ncbi:MAG: hypothetical protein AB1486_24230 [Planctomycetota bacterium]